MSSKFRILPVATPFQLEVVDRTFLSRWGLNLTWKFIETPEGSA